MCPRVDMFAWAVVDGAGAGWSCVLGTSWAIIAGASSERDASGGSCARLLVQRRIDARAREGPKSRTTGGTWKCKLHSCKTLGERGKKVARVLHRRHRRQSGGQTMERKGVHFWKCPSFVSPKVQGSRFRCPGLLNLQNWGISKLERFSTHPSSASPPLCRLCNTRAISRPFHPVFYTSEVSHRQANHWPISANPESFCLFGRPILLLRSS